MKFSFSLLILCQILYFTKIILCDSENVCDEFNPCKNMADCFKWDDDSTRVKCVCKRGFNGNLCEICNKTDYRVKYSTKKF